MIKLYYNRKLKKKKVYVTTCLIFFSGNFKECSKSICDYLKFSKLKKKVYTHLYRIFLSCSSGTREQN